jgi:uncharacterized protein YhfF
MQDTQTSSEKIWAAFCASTGHNGPLPPIDQFGDTPELVDELLELVLAGTKRATCEIKRWFDSRGEPLPKPGDLWIITDSAGIARCIIETTLVDVCAVRDVDDEFVRIEGEGDKSLKFWKTVHDAYFERQAARDGFSYSDDMLCVCEQFKLVWPKDVN